MFTRRPGSLLRRPLGRRFAATGVAAVLLAVGAGLAGCSSSDPASVAACASPGVDDHQISLGVLYPDSGPVAGIYAAARAGIDARLGAANAAGGVHGRRITYQWRDDQGVPLPNGIGARELVEQRGVFGLIELSVAAAGSAAYLTQRGVPVTGMASDDIWTRAPNMFAATTSTGAAVDTQGQFVQERGGRRAVILQTALSPAQSSAAESYARSLVAAGVQVLGTVTYTSGVDDPALVARRIAATRADTVVGVIEPHDLVDVVDALRGGGYNPKVVLSANGYDHDLLQTYGPRMAGIAVPVFYRPFELGGPGINAYVTAMHRFAPQVTQPEQDIAVAAYISTDIFLRGLDLAGACPTRARFIEALRGVNSYDADGLINTISFRVGPARPTTCYSFVQANTTGSGFVVVEPNLCGHLLNP
ncbi:ABC-type branched-chain amino acid transport system, periplasmic component [Frankia canadensis]|uniref:ABC-type branched-chain amino acid transport system, periplasmic component n=1 Tax=Frankia canadensis TaxID=1836972 RepID=A0A2I2KKQ8_9ACTN|nr:ABC transporter substrate-binding protein [Frankia canadensis]SNQ46258.1 ABC-type branched-chain amino acid transport system, periplasmic component [Frankia canadensis]SOU53548.1 ABC-type branched-chain amino acid transport system, periplasmic component [Frankia canadensis]